MVVLEQHVLVVLVVLEVKLARVEFQIFDVDACAVEHDVNAFELEEANFILDLGWVESLQRVDEFDRDVLVGLLGGHHFLFAHCRWSVLKLFSCFWLKAFSKVNRGFFLDLLDLFCLVWVINMELERVSKLLVGHANKLENFLEHIL